MTRLPSRPILVLLTVFLALASALIVRQRIVQIGTAALVNGERISVEPIDKQIELMKSKEPAYFRVDPGQQKELALRKEMVDTQVQLRIISQAARGSGGVTVSNDEIDEELAVRAARYKGETQFNEAMVAQGYSTRVLREETRDLLAQLKMRKKLGREATVAEHEVDSYIAANKEKLDAQIRQVRLTEVKVTGKEQADRLSKGAGKGRVATRAKQLDLPVERYWQREDLLDYKLHDAVLETGVGDILWPLVHPDSTVSLYEVHEWRARRSDEDELRRQVSRKLLWDKQQASFPQWLATLNGSADVRVFD